MSDPADLVVARYAEMPIPEPDPLKGGDVYGWAMDQADLIRAQRFHEIDWVNVADEIESVGKSEFNALLAHTEIVLAQMLGWDHQPSRRTREAAYLIDKNRLHIENDLSDSPSLKAKLTEAIEVSYKFARYVAAREFDLALKTFPSTCPYDWGAIMSRPFVLDQTDEAL